MPIIVRWRKSWRIHPGTRWAFADRRTRSFFSSSSHRTELAIAAHSAQSPADSGVVMQFAPPDRGRQRNAEIAQYLRRLGVHLSLVTDGDEAARYRDVADIVYALPSTPASLVPLVYALPGQLLSVATARRVGGSLYGMAERVHKEDGDPQIYESEIAS